MRLRRRLAEQYEWSYLLASNGINDTGRGEWNAARYEPFLSWAREAGERDGAAARLRDEAKRESSP